MVTRLYFHSTTNSTVGLPISEQSSLTANTNVEGSQTTNRQMDTTIGTGMTGLSTTIASGTNNYYFTRFVSPPIFQTSLSANTWTYNFAAHQNHVAGNFPVSGVNQPVRVNCYVWRPGTGLVGTILDGNTTASTVDEGASAATLAHHVTFTGSAVASMQNNDVIVFEVWFILTPDAPGRTGTFYYDGTTVNTTDNASVSNHASFLETPEDLVLAGAEAFERDVTGDFIIESAIARKKKAIVPLTANITMDSAVAKHLSATRTITENHEIVDSVARHLDVFRTLGESIEVEALVIGDKVFARGVIETFMIESAVTRFLDAIRTIGVPIEIADTIARSKRVFMSIAEQTIGPILDSVSRQRDVNRTLNETSTTIDAPVVRIYSTTRSATGSFTIEDAVVRLKRAIVALTEPISVLDTASRFLRAFRSFSHNIVFVESIHGSKIFLRDLIESLDVSEAVARLYRAIKTPTDNIIINSVVLGLTGPFFFLRNVAATVEVDAVVAAIRRVPRLCSEAIAIVGSVINKKCIAYED